MYWNICLVDVWFMQSCSVAIPANFSAVQLDATDLISASASSQRMQANPSIHLLGLDIHIFLRDPLLLLCSLCFLISLSLDSLFSLSPKIRFKWIRYQSLREATVTDADP